MRASVSQLQRKSVVTTLSFTLAALLSAAPSAWAQYQDQHRREHGNKQNFGDLIRREEQMRRRDSHHDGHRMRLHDGRWQHWNGGRFRAAPPPIGFWLPSLPNFHRIWRSAGTTYYVVDNAWFRPAEHGGYIAIAAPIEPPTAVVAPVAPPTVHNSFVDDLYAYPKGTQTPARMAADKQECAQWSGSQVLADPWAAPYTEAQKSNYVRAFSACMEARNYVVR
jgi:Ni/Co efflux regulator RcnB